MALLHVDFFSDVLGMSVNMDVFVPQMPSVVRPVPYTELSAVWIALIYAF